MQTPLSSPTQDNDGGWLRYLLLSFLLLLLIGLGYAGFRWFASTAMPRPDVYNLLVLALMGGLASFFSPCAFPLLPGYLSFYATVEQDSSSASSGPRVLWLGLAAAAGVITFNLILGGVIGLIGAGAGEALSISASEPSLFVRWFRAGIGVILIGLGAAQWWDINLKPALADAMAWRTRPNRQGEGGAGALYLYGLGYNAAGMGCTGPILAGLILTALASGGFQAALGSFIVFSLTMGSLMLIVSGLVAASQDTLIRRLKTGGPHLKKMAAILLGLVGFFNIVTSLNVELFVHLFFPGG